MELSRQTESYCVFYEHRPEYLFVYMGGESFNYDSAKKFWQEILPVINRGRYKYVMIERDVRQGPSPTETFTLIRELSNSRFTDVKFAIVDGYCTEEDLLFEETVGTNRGLKIKIMRTSNEAEKWLSDPTLSAQPHEAHANR